MLRELSVQNLALIEDVRVELEPGFCAWTGETGAGKTLILSAVNLLLGERGSADLIRAGAEELRIVGRFELLTPPLLDGIGKILDGSLEDDQLLLSRRLTRAGRSYAYVNERPVSVATLRQIGALLVDVHGQRETQSLLETSHQMRLLDSFGELEPTRQAYEAAAQRVRHLRRRHADLVTHRQQRHRELSLIRFERDELAKANLRAGEFAELTTERDRLAQAHHLQALAENAWTRLYEEEGSIVEQIGKLLREAEDYVELDPGLGDAVRRLEGLQAEVQDLADAFRVLGQRWEADPARLEESNDRLQLLRRLETKYARPVEELIAYAASLNDKERTLQGEEEDLTKIEDDARQAFEALEKAGAELSRRRRRVADRLAQETQKQLADLAMPDARLEVRLDPCPPEGDPLTAPVPVLGFEQIELMLAANEGEPARPLRKVASGGELSRTLLALKTVLTAHDQVGTLIFDEIDANVGGRLGDALGQKLALVGHTHQVICITHLPQVASYARSHWTIRKVKRGKRTATEIIPLDESKRLDELASMLRGDAREASTRQEAAAMLAAARKSW